MKRKLKLFIASSAVFALAACSAPSIQPSAPSSFSGKQEESSGEANPISENSSEEKRYFTIRWENYDGVLLELDDGVAEGMRPTYDGSIPRRDSDESYDYVFAGWTPEVVPAYEDATYVATYRADALPVRVEVTFDANGGRFADGTEKKTVETVAGSLLTAPESPRKGGYSFSGWALSSGGTKWSFGTDKIESNVTLYAQWDIEDGIVFGVEGASVDQNSLSIWMLVDSLTTSVSLSTKVTVSSGTTWKLYRGESEIPTKIATTSNGALVDGDNQFYIVTSANDGLIEKTYELTIHRSYYVPMRFYFNEELIRTEYAPTGYEWELPDTQEIAGYSFLRWVDAQGSEVNKVTPFSAMAFYAVATANSYAVTLNPAGGSVAQTEMLIDYHSSYQLPVPTRTGYTFNGWYYGNSKLPQSGTWGIPENATLTAHWKTIDYSITYNLNGGTNSADNPWTYTVEDEFDFADPSRRFWNFEGWYSGGERMVGVAPGTTGDLTIEARWSQTDEQKAAEEEEIRHGIMPSFSEDGKYITYGMYPQSEVKDASILAFLDALASPEDNGWYLLDGEYYAKESDSWFAVESIKWRVLESSGGECLLLSDLLLDMHRYDGSSNNYANSEIRSWLNADFYEAAFALGDDRILTAEVDNSAATTDSSWNQYACENTFDKVFLLSRHDYFNASYGFSDSASRQCSPTDYAVARGAWKSSDNGNGYYWTRSPYSSYSSNAWYVIYGGGLDRGDYYSLHVNNSHIGVRPSLRITVAE